MKPGVENGGTYLSISPQSQPRWGLTFNLKVISRVSVGEYSLGEIGEKGVYSEASSIPLGFTEMFLNLLPSVSVPGPPRPALNSFLLDPPPLSC